jgi:hypothetical protein
MATLYVNKKKGVEQLCAILSLSFLDRVGPCD